MEKNAIQYQNAKPGEVSYLNFLEKVFDFSIIGNFLNVGVGTAKLSEAIHNKYRHIDVLQSTDQVADLVNFSPSEQQLGKRLEEELLDGLAKSTGHTLVIFWPSGLFRANIINSLKERSLYYWEEASNAAAMVFKRNRFLAINSAYYFQHLNTSNVNHEKFFLKKGLYWQSFQEAFMSLTRRVKELAHAGKGASILRASDGDYFFIRKIAIGSAKPGRRALTKDYDQINIPLFRKLFWQNDIITVSVEKPAHRAWKKFIFYELADRILWKLKFKVKGHEGFKVVQHFLDPLFVPLTINPWFLYLVSGFFARFKGLGYKQKSRQIIGKTYIPMEAVYALVATKWIFRNFKNQIGLIGGGPKLELIKMLMQHSQYREYMGMDSFTDYLEVPQIGAADDIQALAESLGPRLTASSAEVFLVAAGSSKIGLMPLLKAYSNAIFIDVGCGMDALAGVVLQTRPYFADWVNYRLKNYDYSKVDFMDKGAPEWENKDYKTIWLEN